MLVIGQMSPNSVVNFYTLRWKVDWMSKHLIGYKHHHRNHLKIILPNTKQETRWRRDSLVVSSLPSFDAVYPCYTSKLQPITWWTDYLDVLHSYQPELTNNLLPFWRNLLELKYSSTPDYTQPCRQNRAIQPRRVPRAALLSLPPRHLAARSHDSPRRKERMKPWSKRPYKPGKRVREPDQRVLWLVMLSMILLQMNHCWTKQRLRVLTPASGVCWYQ